MPHEGLERDFTEVVISGDGEDFGLESVLDFFEHVLVVLFGLFERDAEFGENFVKSSEASVIPKTEFCHEVW